MKYPRSPIRQVATRLRTDIRRICEKIRKQFALTSVRLLLFAGLVAGLLALIGASPASGPILSDTVTQPSVITITPTLGNYPDASLPQSTNTIVTPDAAPTNAASMNASTSTDFKGRLEGDPISGVIRVTNAHPAGNYTVTVKAFSTSGTSASLSFNLTVKDSETCGPVTFAPAANFGVGASPDSVVVADFNRDGKQDLATTNGSSANASILLGDGVGGFGTATNLTVGAPPVSLAVGDFNGDGKQDLAVAFLNGVSVLLGDGTGGFSVRTNFSAGGSEYSVAVGDFNSDGRQDLAVANNIAAGTVSILLGDGFGSFNPPTHFGVGSYPYSVAVSDFNGDGNQDLAVANHDTNNVSVLLGDGTGNFGAATNFAVAGFAITVTVGDFNADGTQDLAVATGAPATNNVAILLGDGTGNFGAATNFAVPGFATSIVVGDFNVDGRQDLAVANYRTFPNVTANDVSILLGDGTGSFGAAINFGVGSFPESIAVGDFNGDGKQDLVTANDLSNNVSILLRDCTVTPTNVVSRKTHGGAGTFDIDLPLSGLPGTLGIECRTGGTTNDHQLVVTYSATVTVSGNPQAQVTSGAGAIGSGGVSNGGMVLVSGSSVTIPLTNVTTEQVINVTLYGVDGGGNLVIPMGVLNGDVNESHGVNASDITLTKIRVGSGVDATTFRSDVNANGSINASDVSLVKSKSGTAIP